MTRLPFSTDAYYAPDRFAASPRYYPLVGLIIGCFAAAVYFLTSLLFPTFIAVLLSTAFTLIFTGVLHEDGLADMFDGIGGSPTPERALEIMKDSRIGVFGATALFMTLAIKITTLAQLQHITIVVALIAAHSLSRWSCVMVMVSSEYVRENGKSEAAVSGNSLLNGAVSTTFALMTLAGLSFTSGAGVAIGAFIGLLTGHGLSRALYERKFGGYTGDCLGSTQQLSEIGTYLGILACRSF